MQRNPRRRGGAASERRGGVKNCKIEDLKTVGLQIRCRLSEETIRDYMDAVRDGAVLPPVTVFEDEERGALYLADGFHRVEAARRLAQKTVRAEVRKGGYAEALAYALGANSSHGLRRTNEDKRNAVRVAWENRQMLFGVDNPSARAIAEACGVSQQFVINQVSTVASCQVSSVDTCKPKTVVGRDGKTYPLPPVPTRRATPPAEEAPPAPLPPVPARDDRCDMDGRTIPPEILDVWNRRQILMDLVRQAQSIRRGMREGYESQDMLFAGLAEGRFKTFDTAMETVVRQLQWAVPEIVCPACQGIGRDGCRYCHGSGLVSKKYAEAAPIDGRWRGPGRDN